MAKEILQIRVHLHTQNMETLEVTQGNVSAIVNDTETGEGHERIADSSEVTTALATLLAAVKTEVEAEEGIS